MISQLIQLYKDVETSFCGTGDVGTMSIIKFWIIFAQNLQALTKSAA
jgi:hypothetical protein